MLRLGAHVSIAGGISKAVLREKEVGGNCAQIFVSSPRAWAVSTPPVEEVERFIEGRRAMDIGPFAVHSKYLVNLGTHNEAIFNRSIAALQSEIEVASLLRIEYVVFHPGAYTGGSDRAGAMSRVSSGLGMLEIPKGVKVLLENTSGRGTTLGRTFEELAMMMEDSAMGYERLGACFDTCHGFCAGYPLHEPGGIESAIDEIDNTIGMGNLCLIHLNDSKHPYDSRKDEHQHIGEGHIGLEAFRVLVNHEKAMRVPMVLETPVTEERGYEQNIALVRSLVTAEPQ